MRVRLLMLVTLTSMTTISRGFVLPRGVLFGSKTANVARPVQVVGRRGVTQMSAHDVLKVYLVRHGAVDLNTPGMVFPKDCFYGGHNVPLSDLGKLEAQVCSLNGNTRRMRCAPEPT